MTTSSSSDIRNRTFGKSFRGFNPGEVMNFLGELAARIDELSAANTAASQRVVELETRLKDYTTIEKALQQTLMQAQETSGKAVESARKEGQLIIQEAELKASQIVDKARSDLTLLREQITIMQTKRDSIISRLKTLLDSELGLVKALGTDDDETAPHAGGDAPAAGSGNSEIDEILKHLENE